MKKILGDIAVRENGNGWTARHCGKSATCTSSEQGAMDQVLGRFYGEGTFYYRLVSMKWPPGKGRIHVYNALVEREEEA